MMAADTSAAVDDKLAQRRRVLIVGGGLAGMAAARELRSKFRVTVVDAKEYFEFASGIMRAYVKPSHWDSLTFGYREVLERNWGVRFIWGEVLSIDSQQRSAQVKTMFAKTQDIVPFDFCLLAAGCNYNQLNVTGESPWVPTVHERARAESEIGHLDERFLEGRRRRILEEHLHLRDLNRRQAKVLIVGAGFMGVEWACELRHFFPDLRITLTDFLPRCLGPLPEAASKYCEDYMQSHDIRTVYGVKYDRDSPQFWVKVGLPDEADRTYSLSGVKTANYFMPKSVLSERGPGGGGWILTNKQLQVVTKQGELWGDGRIFAVGDCILGCVGEPPNWEIPPIPKTGYPAEQQAVHACRNIRALDVRLHIGGSPGPLVSTWYPWGAGIFTISLGPLDGCLVIGATPEKNSGHLFSKGSVAVAQKELIESTKMAQSRGDHILSRFIWYTVHHWPVNLWGPGPLLSL